MSPKHSRLIFASHSSTGSPSSFSKDNLDLHVGESVCDKYQNFTDSPAAVAMAHRENGGQWIYRQVKTAVRIHWAVIGFSLKANFGDVLSVLTRHSKAAVKLPSHVGSTFC